MQRINDAEQLGRAIRSKRKKLTLSQVELAAFTGVGVRFVRELEQGSHPVILARRWRLPRCSASA